MKVNFLKFIFLSSFFVFTIFLFKKSISFIKQPLSREKISIVFDSIYSATVKNDLYNFVIKSFTSENFLSFDLVVFSNELKRKFDIVKEVVLDFTKPKAVKLKIVGSKPFFKINNKIILTDNENFFDSDFFKDYNLDQLQNINISEDVFEKSIRNNLYSFLSKIPENLLLNYDISYLKDSNFMLSSKKNKFNLERLLVLDGECFLDSKKIICTEKIGQILDRNFGVVNRFCKRKRKGYKFDLRFKNRILVSLIQNKNRGRG